MLNTLMCEDIHDRNRGTETCGRGWVVRSLTGINDFNHIDSSSNFVVPLALGSRFPLLSLCRTWEDTFPLDSFFPLVWTDCITCSLLLEKVRGSSTKCGPVS